jgi:predicted RNase H-like HicB family nuclease
MTDSHAKQPGFIVILTDKGQGPVHAGIPELEGCHAEGRTREEALENARRAIRGHLQAEGAAPRKKVWLETITVNVPQRPKG